MNSDPHQLPNGFIKPSRFLNCRGRLVDLSKPAVMGIINLTPDSFYPGSRFGHPSAVLKRIGEMVEAGGTMVDIGAYSSRPGGEHITEVDEVQRLMPVLEIIRKEFPYLILSVDTFRSGVAFKAVREFQVDMINDISGGDLDPRMLDTMAELQVPYVLMHMQGTPQTMQQNTYYQDVVGEVLLNLAQKTDLLRSKGINDIIIDPGFGFGKSLAQNHRLLHNLDQFAMFELPILIGVSRKSMIYNVLECSADESLNGTTVLNTLALLKGAAILRVHDVKEAVECVKLVNFEKE